MGGHYTTAASQPAIMTREHLEQCRHLLGDVPEWVEREADIRSVESRNFAEREVVGAREMVDTSKARAGFSGSTHSPGFDGSKRMVNITAPATPEAQQWSGWGTALKPALEPITVARKPLGQTVAECVLKHGTGAINVDGCRVGTDGGAYREDGPSHQGALFDCGNFGALDSSKGGWPANFIHDGSEEPVVLLGDAASFFYCAKTSKADREEGNNHPTVKPTDLMRYLCRLITPPGGIVLDPFMGSGSTGKAAIVQGFRFIGIEREEEYLEIAQARIEAATTQGVLPE
jgi:site-specific DNA-methyltransferase (adenine-specific)